MNLTVTEATEGGNLRLHPPGLSGRTSAINFTAGVTRANNAVVALDSVGRVEVFCSVPAGQSAQLIVDVSGYFE